MLSLTPPAHASTDHPITALKLVLTPVLDLIRGRVERDRTQQHVEAPFETEDSKLPPIKGDELGDELLLSSAAAEIYRMRRARDRHIPRGLVGEPAWDILLTLYAEADRNITISSLCYASAVPQTTALRWIGTLQEEGLVGRVARPDHGRKAFISLTENGRLVVERCLRAMLRSSPR